MMSAWYPTGDQAIALIVDEETILSPHYYRWLKAAAAAYYLDPDNFDPRVIGIGLQRPVTI